MRGSQYRHGEWHYLNPKEIRDTQTTNKSRRLKAERQKAPLWSTNPYAMTFKAISIVKTVVKK
jgi:hypothetical protein